MPSILSTIRMAGGRLKGLSAAVDPDEPVRKAEQGSGGETPAYVPRRVQTLVGATGAVTCNWALYDEVRLSLVGNVVLTFSGAVDGQGCTLKISQDATGSRTVTLPGTVRYSSDITGYAPTTTGSKSDRVGFIHDAGDSKYDFVSVIKGF